MDSWAVISNFWRGRERKIELERERERERERDTSCEKGRRPFSVRALYLSKRVEEKTSLRGTMRFLRRNMSNEVTFWSKFAG